MHSKEFQEIAHCGGKVTISIRTTTDDRRQSQIGIQHSAPVPAAFFAVYALPQGIAVGDIQLGGIGDKWNPPPIQGCYPVFIASDSEGMFGSSCPSCSGYWRTSGGVLHCPYCGIYAERYQFLTKAQRHYVAQYCELMNAALDVEDGDHVIDMDAVADATGKDEEKPPFYYAEVSQQTKFTCEACGQVSDILGSYGYCSTCNTRNDLQQIDAAIRLLHERIKGGGTYENCVKDAVTLFDSFTNQLAKELLSNVPMTPARRNRIEKRSLHKLDSIAMDFQAVFDIDILAGMSDEDVKFTAIMFHRRNVYEHNGGEADEQYIIDSGDSSVQPKQALRETNETAHKLANIVLKMASNLHQGFHAIFPPEDAPVHRYAESKKRMRSK